MQARGAEQSARSFTNRKLLLSLLTPELIKAAQDAQRKYGVAACVSLAQYGLESGWGKYLSAQNNPFGIKSHAGSGHAGRPVLTKEYVNGQWVTIRATFVAFPSIADAFDFHARMLVDPKGPYKSILPYLHDWSIFLIHLAPIYASDPTYSSKIGKIISQNHLEQYNNVS